MNGEGLNGFGTFFRAKAGMLAIFFFMAVGWYSAMRYAGITGLPQKFEDMQAANTALEARVTVVEDSVSSHYETVLYTICTQIPPLKRDVKRALRIDCGPIDTEVEQEIGSRGFPTDEEPFGP